jgi:threonine/homoserine/homoserine lactone efflux protein
MALVTDTVYALAASVATPALAHARGGRTAGRYLTGGAFIGLGVFTAFAGSRSAK